MIRSYTRGEVPSLTSAEQFADFAYVTDIARALMYACEKGKKNTAYYVGYGHPRPLKEFIIELRNIVNEKIESGIGLKDFNGHNVDFTKIDVEKLTRDTGIAQKSALKTESGCAVMHIYREESRKL